MHRFESRLPKPLYDALMQQARAEGVPAAELTRKALCHLLGLPLTGNVVFKVPPQTSFMGVVINSGNSYTLSKEQVDEIRETAVNKKIQAIRRTRELTGCGLMEAKWIVENLPAA